LRITDLGAATLEECDARTRAWLCERLSGLTETDLERLDATLRELRELLVGRGA
jgi:DNA-binding MarR family transcriptional regulator